MRWHTTDFKGVRYREHESRIVKLGIIKQRDRYFAVRYQHEGRRIEEGLGWLSEGWTADKAALKLAELREAARTGKGPARLAEARAIAKEARTAKEADEVRRAAESRTFADYFLTDYLPRATADKKPHTIKCERETLARWAAQDLATPCPGWQFLGHDIGSVPMKDVTPFDIERVKKAMRDAGRAPRTIQYCLGLIRHVFRRALKDKVFVGIVPTEGVELPKFDNRRLRRIAPEQIDHLLHVLRHGLDTVDKDGTPRRFDGSEDVADMALLSLLCALRAGECFALTWGDVDLARSILTLRDTKNAATRTAYLGKDTRAIFERRTPGLPSDLVFPVAIGENKGNERIFMSKTFTRVVDALGLNDGVTDRRQRFVFHSLRHEFASRLADNGESPFVIQALMGHKTITMAQRYTHLSDDTLRQAALAAAQPRTTAQVVNLDDRRRHK